jgi:hypothetical protein
MKKKRSKQRFPAIPALPDEILIKAFPDGFSLRDEANALTAYAFRNGPLEDLHAGKPSALTVDSSLSRITEAEMKELMINASEKLALALNFRDTEPEKYRRFVQAYGFMYCRAWNR